jgi:hypothetical protein
MAILCFLGFWVLYIWLVQKCIRSAARIKVGDRKDIETRKSSPRVKIPDTVPSEWIEAYKAENDA